MRSCCIIGAGEFDPSPSAMPTCELVIAADGGYRIAREHGISVDLVIGDFDSLGEVPCDIEYLRLPVEKDVTDTAAAVEIGISRGCSRFFLLGCMGGRPDHTQAALALIADLSRRGFEAHLLGAGYDIFAVTNGAVAFPAAASGTLSIFSASGTANGVTLEGLYYPLRDASLDAFVPLGVSNSFLEGVPARVEVREGTLLLFVEGSAASSAEMIRD